MNWRIETEIDYFIVIKPSQAIETSQIFREKKAQTRYAAHTHWLHINDKIFIINIALHGYYILPDTVSGPGVGGGALTWFIWCNLKQDLINDSPFIVYIQY